jgi:hypothetical protein
VGRKNPHCRRTSKKKQKDKAVSSQFALAESSAMLELLWRLSKIIVVAALQRE